MPQVALHSVLREGTEAEYEREHERIPEDLAATFARVAIKDWRIWRSGRNLFHLVECDDFDAAMRELEDDPANVRWQAHIGQYVDRFISDAGDGAPRPLGHVWNLADQSAQT